MERAPAADAAKPMLGLEVRVRVPCSVHCGLRTPGPAATMLHTRLSTGAAASFLLSCFSPETRPCPGASAASTERRAPRPRANRWRKLCAEVKVQPNRLRARVPAPLVRAGPGSHGVGTKMSTQIVHTQQWDALSKEEPKPPPAGDGKRIAMFERRWLWLPLPIRLEQCFK